MRRRRPADPSAIERAYTRDLVALSRALARVAKRALASVNPEARADAEIGGVDFTALRLRLGRLASRRGAVLVARYGRQLKRFSAAQIASVLLIDIAAEPAAVLSALAAWRAENISLITSIAERLHDDVREVVAEAVLRGVRSETLARRLEERYSVSASRARLIARDQTAKGNADLQRVRAREAGVTRYVWSTSRDERVRPMHAALDGRVFSYGSPPITNDKGTRNEPGHDFQCRCVAVPVLDA